MAVAVRQRPKTARRARPGHRLLRYDRTLGARFVGGTDEAGRGALAGPLVAAAVLLDYHRLQGRVCAPLAQLDDSKTRTLAQREELYDAVLACASGVSVIVGDGTSAAIAAASIVAKVTRDRLMRRLHSAYPAYGFDGHVGYSTPQHRDALRDHGPCPLHRRSFATVGALQLSLLTV